MADLDFEIPPGWLPHPDHPGWFYKGDKVKDTDQLRKVAQNRTRHLQDQVTRSVGKQPPDKIMSSQHPKAGDMVAPGLRELIDAARQAADEALPHVLLAAVQEHQAPADAPVGAALDAAAKGRSMTDASIRKLAQSQAAMAMAQLSVIACDPLQLGPTRVSAAAHILERAHGKPQQMFSPLRASLADLPAKQAYDVIVNAAQAGEISIDELKALTAFLDSRSKALDSADLAERMARLEALLAGGRTIPAASNDRGDQWA